MPGLSRFERMQTQIALGWKPTFAHNNASRELRISMLCGAEERTAVLRAAEFSSERHAMLTERDRCARIAEQFPNLMAQHIARLIRGGQ
jgi:hypothetical protein